MRHERFRGAEVEAQLARVLLASATTAGVVVEIEQHRSRPWASATFVGAQHRLTLAATPEPRQGEWVAGLAEAEFALRGHVVVSLEVERPADGEGDGRIALSVLTIED